MLKDSRIDLQHVISSFKELGITMKYLEILAEAHAASGAPFIQNVLEHWEASTPTPYTWTVDDSDMLVNFLQNLEVQNVISSFQEIGVSMTEFENFVGAYNILEAPLIQEVLSHWDTPVASSSTYSWTVDDDDMILNLLQSQETDISSTDDDAFETWEAEFQEDVMRLTERVASPKDDDFELEPWSPGLIESLRQAEVTVSAPKADEFDFEPWSPGLIESLRQAEVTKTSTCAENTKSGKKFYCARCQVVVIGYEEFARHRETHVTRQPEVPMEAGPSGLQESRPITDFEVEAQEGGAQDAYRIERTGIRRFAHHEATEITFKVRFNDQWYGERLADLRQQLHQLFEELLAKAREDVADNDLIRVVLRHDDLNRAIVVPLQEAGDLDVEKIMAKVESVLQSEENLSMDDSFQVIVGALHIPQGTGGPRRRITQLTGPDNSIHKKTSMVQIVNNDTLCMSRAISVCYAKQCVVSADEWGQVKDARKDLTNPEILVNERKTSIYGYTNMKNKNRQEQTHVATLICQKAGIPTDRPGSLNDLPFFEDALQIRIAVVAASLGNKFIRVPTDNHEDRPLIYLYLVDHRGVSHFHAIVNITGFFSANYFCERCLKHYNNKTGHRCETKCITCKSGGDCPETEETVNCDSCNMVCRSRECFDRHLVKTTRKNGDKGEITVSECDMFWRCKTCKKVLNRLKRPVNLHKCTEWFCKCCHSWCIGDHQCYLFPEEPKKPLDKFIFFDFEATQDTIAECAEGFSPKNCCPSPCKDCMKCQHCFKSWCGQPRHVPNFVLAQTVCKGCSDEPLSPESTCEECGNRCDECDTWDKEAESFAELPCPNTCGLREVMFCGDDTLEEFGNWLFSTQHKDATVLAHNMKGYDGVFLLEYLVNNSIRPSKVIYNGSKIMYMEVAKGLHIRVLDSLNFLPMKLAALPEAFGLTELCKGFFPHFFNTRENQHYVGPYPEPEAYGARFMSTDARAKFLKWHEEKAESDSVFDFKNEIETYCRSDVDILRRACLQFRQLMLDATDVDPFQYVTIASVCMGIYKTRFLEAEYRATFEMPNGMREDMVKAKKSHGGWSRLVNSRFWSPVNEEAKVIEKKPIVSQIAQVPSAGYTQRDTFSKASIQWLEFIMELARKEGEQLNIEHAVNGHEVQIVGTNYKVDGRAGNTVYEYHGCIWHGCTDCYPDRTTKNPKTGQTMDQLFALTKIKENVLTRDLRFKYVCIWEHDWLKRIRDESDVRDFVSGLDIQERLDPRDSFFGGRTNAAKLHYKAEQDEEIKYVDFTSLYPYVNKYSCYPVGHPSIITRDFEDIRSYFGIVKAKIRAPRRLYHPVLPYRSNGKLKFPLCRTCADDESRTTCRHKDEQRCFVGTWCTPEILKALDNDYEIVKIYEVYHWDESTQYDPQTKEGGLFVTYVNTFLKFKQEASGWPKWCCTDEDRDRYLSDYFEKEGIRLDPMRIEMNPGLRALAKLCLNSFWGKFGQRLNQGVCEFIHSSEMDKFYKLLTDRTKKVNDFHIINEDHLHLEYEHQSGFVPEDMKTNIFLATFTTCWARLKLFDVLKQLDERVLYYDTDSVIYVSRPGMFDPPLGDYLGDLTDELDPGDYILEYVSAGPKNYAYTTTKGKQTCKIRGFSLNYTNAQLLNFDSVKTMVASVQPDKPATYNKRKREDDEQPSSKIIVVTNPSKISRDKYNNILYNKVEKKQYRVVYDKRVIVDAYDTVPFGYCL